VFVFSGYDQEEILADRDLNGLLEHIDLIIAGPYRPELFCSRGLLASSNQRVMRLSDRMNDISSEELHDGERKIEAHIVDGEVRITGLVHPDKVKQLLGEDA